MSGGDFMGMYSRNDHYSSIITLIGIPIISYNITHIGIPKITRCFGLLQRSCPVASAEHRVPQHVATSHPHLVALSQ